MTPKNHTPRDVKRSRTHEQLEAKRARDRAAYRNNAQRRKAYNRQRLYGVTEAFFQQVVREQGNACLICKQVFTRTPHVDHDHGTGMLRGILCPDCNTGLGHLKDSIDNLRSAIAYLEAFNAHVRELRERGLL